MKKNVKNVKLSLERETLIELNAKISEAVDGGAYSRFGCTAVGTRVCTSADC